MKNFINKIVFILLFSAVCFAQQSGDSLSFALSNYANKRLASSFDKQLNIYNLNASLNYGIDQKNWFFGIDEKFRSTLIKSTSVNIKDEQFLSLIGEYKLTDYFKSGALMKYNIYSDDRKLAINRASNLSSSLFLKFIPYPNLSIVPFGGYLRNQQIGKIDDGSIYGAEANVNNLNLPDFTLNADAKFLNEDISPRKNTLRAINTALFNNLTPQLSNDMRFHYSESRKDFYFEADSITHAEFDVKNNIQSRTESNYFLREKLFYFEPAINFALDFDGRIGWRNIDRHTRYVSIENAGSSSFDTKIEEFRINLASSAAYRKGIFSGRLRLEFAERDEKHKVKPIEGVDDIYFFERETSEQRKNNISKLTTLSLNTNFELSKKDNILFSALQRKLVYDTPSEENNDDRDELLSTFQLYYTRLHNKFFNFFVNLEGGVNHIVYIFAERSSNNNIKRYIKMASGGGYNSFYFRSTNKIEVSANYTVFDFEDLTPNFQSYSFRQYAVWDSSQVRLTAAASIDFLGYLKLSEQGDFSWGDFTGKPIRFLKEIYLVPKLVYHWGELNIGVGVRYFSLSAFKFDGAGNRELETEYISAGPISQINISIFNRLDIFLIGWYEFITNEDNKQRELANMNLRVRWNI